MKKSSIITDLRHIFHKDFKDCCANEFENFKNELTKNIIKSKRSLQDQKMEAIAILETKKNRNIIAVVALSVSFASIATTLINASLNFSQDIDKKTTALIVLFLLVLFIGCIIMYTFHVQRKIAKLITYYKIKLHCIELIESSKKKKDNSLTDKNE